MEMHTYEKEHLEALRPWLADCTVLLRTNGAFPLNGPCKLALYGAGARHTIKGGTGSGDVNVRFYATVEQALKNAGFQITTAKWLAAYDADFFLASANAMTEDGVIINIDGNANRVSAIAQGPRHVIFIVGMNKICDDVDGALKRARNVAAPINAQRFGLNTPCTKTGSCMDCKTPDTICCQFLITRYSKHPGRIYQSLYPLSSFGQNLSEVILCTLTA